MFQFLLNLFTAKSVWIAISVSPLGYFSVSHLFYIMNPENDTEPQPQRGLNIDGFKAHVIANKIDCGLWAMRILVLAFSIGYLIPIFG